MLELIKKTYLLRSLTRYTPCYQLHNCGCVFWKPLWWLQFAKAPRPLEIRWIFTLDLVPLGGSKQHFQTDSDSNLYGGFLSHRGNYPVIIIHFERWDFHQKNHPFGGYPHLWKPPYCMKFLHSPPNLWVFEAWWWSETFEKSTFGEIFFRLPRGEFPRFETARHPEYAVRKNTRTPGTCISIVFQNDIDMVCVEPFVSTQEKHDVLWKGPFPSRGPVVKNLAPEEVWRSMHSSWGAQS